MARTEEHIAWNLAHDLDENEVLPLCCPRCLAEHEETLTSDPAEPDYFHHVHQCTHCGLRFDLFVRCRAGGAFNAPGCDTRLVSKRELVASQVAAMHSITGNVRASLNAYIAALCMPRELSGELHKRLATDPAAELAGAFDLIIRRVNALIEQSVKVALENEEPIASPKDPPS